MLRVLAMTFLGLVTEVTGFFLAYFYITGIDLGRTPLLLIPSFGCIALGVYLLLRAGASDATVITKAKIPELKPEKNPTKGLGSVLERNNSLSSEWNKTEDQRTKLKLLQASASAQSPEQ